MSDKPGTMVVLPKNVVDAVVDYFINHCVLREYDRVAPILKAIEMTGRIVPPAETTDAPGEEEGAA